MQECMFVASPLSQQPAYTGGCWGQWLGGVPRRLPSGYGARLAGGIKSNSRTLGPLPGHALTSSMFRIQLRMLSKDFSLVMS